MLLSFFQEKYLEVGCDEAGRGCLAGPVFAAAVIFDKKFTHAELNDSKKLSLSKRHDLRKMIEDTAMDFAVAKIEPAEIDQINIHQASYKAMHLAVDQLKIRPELILVDGNKFIPYPFIAHECIVKGDGKYLSIAAASILAKTYRDEYMKKIADEYPQYHWSKNNGYPTIEHRNAILEHGLSPYHRVSFRVTAPRQMAKAAPNTKMIDAINEMISPR
jgi:ribonuclease HII